MVIFAAKVNPMRKIVLPLIVIGIALLVVFKFFKTEEPAKPRPPKAEPVAVSKYSAAFNDSVNNALNAYYSLSEAFVNWDSNSIKSKAIDLKDKMGRINYEELKKDEPIYQTAVSYKENFNSELDAIINAKDLAEKRQNFNAYSQNLYDLLRTIRFDGSKVFLQECPMAFNDTESGLWLSNHSDIRNPYLGLYHPKYKGAMLECGETKDSLRFGVKK